MSDDDAARTDAAVDPALVARTVQLAVDNVAQGGKPFACVVADASTGQVLVEATNQVAQSGDVTAHAEVTAIRELAQQGRDTLAGCVVYVTAYPCPMCLGALYYAEPDLVAYAVTREEEGEHYEDGGRYMRLATFYDEFALAPEERSLPAARYPVTDPTAPFRAWSSKH